MAAAVRVFTGQTNDVERAATAAEDLVNAFLEKHGYEVEDIEVSSQVVFTGSVWTVAITVLCDANRAPD
jgi:hypothetical protein